MVREELYITVPSLFRCPISLDVMKSPVSLCTGVTYDRSSIQHWLESGHDTCPATNQPLPSKDFVPNLTLHRLINLWIQSSDARGSGIGSPLPALPPPAITKAEIRELVRHIQDGSRLDSIGKIAEFAGYSEENRRFLVNISCFVEVMVDTMTRNGVKIQVLESILKVLDLILPENRAKEQIHKSMFRSDRGNCFDSIILVIRNGRLTSKTESVRVLESIALDTESRRSISEKENILPSLIHLLRTETDKALRDAVLSCLITFSVTRSIKAQLVQLGLVPILSGIISAPERDSAVSSAEKAMKLVHVASAIAEGRRAISEDPNCAVAIMERLMKVSRAAKEDGVATLWSLSFVYGDEGVKERLGRSNGVTKLLLVMQSEGDGGIVKRMCGDLVKVLRGVGMAGSSGLGSYETKTTHIRPY